MKKPKSYLHVKTYSRKGKWYRYFRHRSLGKDIRLPVDLESREGREAYDACMRMIENRPSLPLKTGSLGLLIKLYMASPEYAAKKPNTRRQYDLFLTELNDKYGDLPVSTLPRSWVIQMRDARAHKPRTANYMISVISILMQFAYDREWRQDNPALKVKRLKEGSGSDEWSLLHLQKIRRVAPPEFLYVIASLVFCGQRQGDVIRFVWSKVKGNMIEIKHRKTGKEAYIPIHPIWKIIIDSMPKTGVLMHTQPSGKPWTEDRLQKLCKKYVKEAGIQEKITLHGLSKTAIGALADAGCTEEEIEAVTGKSSQMIKRYLLKHKKRKLAYNAGKKMSNVTSIGKR